jgi:ribosomal protein L9
VEPNTINIAKDSIKELGEYEAVVKLDKAVTATVKFEVVAD